MEIEITEFVKEWDGAWMDFSASVAEIGHNAGQYTWRAAMEAAEDLPILTTEDQLDAAREYFAEFGAWTEEEIGDMSDQELNALLIQFIAGKFREIEASESFEAWSENWGGDLYPCDIDGPDKGKWYFYLGI